MTDSVNNFIPISSLQGYTSVVLNTKMPTKKNPLPIDPRAWKGAAIILGAALLSTYFFQELSLIVWVLLFCHLAFFREPSFKLPAGEVLSSPSYGQVSDIEKVFEDRFLHEEAYRIGIFMSVLVPHITLSPMRGKIGYLEHVPGKFLHAMSQQAPLKNECNWIGIEDAGTRVMVRQITGAIARRIFWDVEIGSEVEAGEKLGVICYGSRVECYLPARLFKPAVKVGDNIKAGSTVIGDRLL
ncbi:MAG: phosphatidylserine decarboxylase family protein [Candidatus Omnitrophica bacterium]|nr:phosphatidylserine decarboxylase family protein [Candidatus Omnitrophota bacterium]